VINGKAVDWRNQNLDSTLVNFVNRYPHHDLSANFPKFMMLSRASDTSPYQDSIVNDCVYYQDKASQADAWLDHVIQSDPGYTFDKSTQLLSQCPLPEHTNVTGAPCFYGSEYEAQFNSLPIKGGKQNIKMYTVRVIKQSFL
jgi:hypothetical protein